MVNLKRSTYEELLFWKNNYSNLTLELQGARQSGKTYILNKFADEEYKHKIYINMAETSGENLIACLEQCKTTIADFHVNEDICYNMFHLYNSTFVDDGCTIIIIDEIQESSVIYNLIRQLTRQLKCHVVVTGSYLGKTLSKEFWTPVGDVYSLTITTLTFPEFAHALGLEESYNNLDLLGNSPLEEYQKLQSAYEVYIQIGGYPAVVKEYITTKSIDRCTLILENIVNLFCNESKRYFDDILDVSLFNDIFCSVARLLLKEKKGLEAGSLSEELQKLTIKEYSSNIDKASTNRAIHWIQEAGIIGYCGKVIDCNVLDFKPRSRCYFMDVGLAYYYFRKIGASLDNVAGLLNESFIYLDLARRTRHLKEIALETPAFAIDGGGELDFFVKSLEDDKKYGIEVKTGKAQGTTASRVLKNGKIDYLLYAKGKTQGGMNGNIFTIPIYMFSCFTFNKGISNNPHTMDCF